MGVMGGLLLVLAASGGMATESCSEQRGFDRGRAGLERAAHCAAGDYASAWRLGGELAALLQQRDLLARGQSGRDEAARLATARRMRQLELDVEAIRGVLQLRGIVVEGPVPEAGAPVDAVDNPGPAAAATSPVAADPE